MFADNEFMIALEAKLVELAENCTCHETQKELEKFADVASQSVR